MLSAVRHLNAFETLQSLSPPTVTWAQQWDTLKEQWAAGTPTEEIAQNLGRTVSAVLTQAARLGLPRRQAQGRKPNASSTKKPRENNILLFRIPVKFQGVQEPERVHLVKERNCLMCSSTFHSHGSHNRICSKCKSGATYQNGHEEGFRVLTA